MRTHDSSMEINGRKLQVLLTMIAFIAWPFRKQHVQLEFSRVRLQALALLLTVLRNSIQFNTLLSQPQGCSGPVVQA